MVVKIKIDQGEWQELDTEGILEKCRAVQKNKGKFYVEFPESDLKTFFLVVGNFSKVSFNVNSTDGQDNTVALIEL